MKSNPYETFLKTADRRRLAIRLAYARNKNMAEVARIYGITRQRVKQIVGNGK